MKILAFAGALRANSVSKQLVREASRFLGERGGVAVDYVDLKQFPFPVYDTDIEETDGIPGTVLELGQRIAHADALVIAAPEYNGAISSVLKALIDWLSRIQPCPSPANSCCWSAPRPAVRAGSWASGIRGCLSRPWACMSSRIWSRCRVRTAPLMPPAHWLTARHGRNCTRCFPPSPRMRANISRPT